MIYGLNEAGALARTCYYAQRLSLLTAASKLDAALAQEAKAALDLAFSQLMYRTEESHGSD